RPGYPGQLPRREKRTREGAGAHHRPACRHIHGSPRRLRSGRYLRTARRAYRGAALADARGGGRVSLLPVVRPRSADAAAQIRSGFSRIHEAIEQPVRRESCTLWRVTKTTDHFTTRTSKSPRLRRTVTLTSSGCRSNSRSTVPIERSMFSSRSE